MSLVASKSRRLSQRRLRERGAVMVEMAIVVPVLMLLVMGMMEVGFRTTNTQAVVAASRSATRVVSSDSNTRLADYDAMQALSGALADFDVSDIQRIIIFKPEADGSLPPLCDTAAQSGLCNHYSGADLSAPITDFQGVAGSTCATSSRDTLWCPLDRIAEQFPSADWIGVRVEVMHHSVAPFLSDTTIVDTTVMRLEPRFNP